MHFLQEKNMVNQLNIVLFSDHGMTKIQWMEKVIELDQYINMPDIVKMMDRGPVVSLWPKENKIQEVRLKKSGFSVLLFWLLLLFCSFETYGSSSDLIAMVYDVYF